MSNCQENVWQQIHLPSAGRVEVVVQANDIIYASGDKVYSSSNEGESWISLPGFGSRVFMRTSEGILFKGNDEFASVYKSTDDGATWQFSGLGRFYATTLNTLCFNPITGDIFAGNSYNPQNAFRTMSRSSDLGATWEEVLGVFLTENGWVTSIEWIKSRQGGLMFAGANVQGLFSSSDNGLSWTYCAGEVRNYTVTCIAFDSLRSMYAGTSQGYILRSNDDGQSWQRFGAIGSPVQALTVAGNFVLAASQSEGIFQTEIDDTIWSSSSNGLLNKHVKSIERLSNGQFIAGTIGSGAYISNDNGKNWIQRNTGMREIQDYSFTSSHDTLFVGTAGNGILQSVDHGLTWTNLFSDSSELRFSSALKVFAFADDIITFTPFGMGIWISQDNGLTWSYEEIGAWGGVADVVMDKMGTLFAAHYTLGLFKKGSGDSIFHQIAFKDTALLAISNPVESTFFVSLNYPGGTFRSTDEGISWQKVFNESLKKIVSYPNSNVLLASGGGPGLKVSYDHGVNWVTVQNEFSAVAVGPLAINSQGKIYLKTPFGVMASTDTGRTWSDFSSGLPNKDINELLLDESGYLYVELYDSEGIFRSSVSTITSVEFDLPLHRVRQYSLSQNYPNPFNPLTTISYSLPHTEFVTLTISNVMGQIITTLVSEKEEGGNYTVQWNGSAYPSGIYFYRLQAGLFTETKKLLLLK